MIHWRVMYLHLPQVNDTFTVLHPFNDLPIINDEQHLLWNKWNYQSGTQTFNKTGLFLLIKYITLNKRSSNRLRFSWKLYKSTIWATSGKTSEICRWLRKKDLWLQALIVKPQIIEQNAATLAVVQANWTWKMLLVN